MEIRKLNLIEWVSVLRALTPHIAALIRIAGVNVVTLVRALLDVAGMVESMFPAEVGPDGKPIKQGVQKREAFIELITAAFVTAEDRAEGFAEVLGRIADSVSAVLTAIGVFKRGAA
jgi:hypothetical protein